ncbi:MAG: hypothetical protein A3H32_11795 [Betaproteobacteria bacterium RIFCSPLOWO2_02_FULL_63_19]|nr:MAG: hypothetical protein A3H32_11795 [Betaproteobacteria bacterium RIFCSPLOWO2_02_FULL_63_19]
MPLTDAAIRRAKPSAKPFRIADSAGLYLEVSPSGGKLWRFKYRFDRKQRMLALGIYPEISLAGARHKRDEARKLLASDTDPSEHRRAAKAARDSLALPIALK